MTGNTVGPKGHGDIKNSLPPRPRSLQLEQQTSTHGVTPGQHASSAIAGEILSPFITGGASKINDAIKQAALVQRLAMPLDAGFCSDVRLVDMNIVAHLY